MAVSDITAEAIFRVIRKHVRPVQMRRILAELISVPGNKSFRDTVEKLLALEAEDIARDEDVPPLPSVHADKTTK